ncbi:hypothetical protein JKP88DRAFT_269548 [Tribonema minus]|uniref:Assembly chaperone of rpl4 n=1 Tax=Tribonema minus TaxID=303371 RepID=A0A835ZAV8_9STRA|nr:hypothetical protein JKP88DRAFT_269548 [Tribonema minus]
MPTGRGRNKKNGKGKARRLDQRHKQQGATAAAAEQSDEAEASGEDALVHDSVEPELALKFYKRALDLCPQDPALLDEAADLLLQLGAADDAKALLSRSIEVAPDASAGKWLYMAQLHEGEEALKLYNRGLTLLEAALAQPAAAAAAAAATSTLTSIPELRQQLSAACCAVAELYMTDLCFAPDAEAACAAALDRALRHDAGGPEAHQAMAHLRLSQGRAADAVPFAKEAARRVGAALAALEGDVMGGGEGGPGPDYGFRVSAAKVLLECADADASCCEDALAVLAGLMQEDDEDVETWFLMGAAFFKQDPPDLELARAHLERAAEMLEKIREHMRKERRSGNRGGGSAQFVFPYEGQVALVREQLALVAEAEADPDIARGGEGEGSEGEGDSDGPDGMDTDE